MQYKILAHPSDVRVQAFGKTKAGLFKNAMLGMKEVLRPKILNSKSEIRNIKVKSVDANALLADFLNEILCQIQTNKEAYTKIEFNEFKDNELEAELSGNKVESFGEEIKAATHHDLKIEQNKEGLWQATTLLDI